MIQMIGAIMFFGTIASGITALFTLLGELELKEAVAMAGGITAFVALLAISTYLMGVE